MVSRGFASESYLHSAAAAINAACWDDDKDTWVRDAVIYYLGDHDPSGLRIDAAIEAGIRRILVSEFGWSEAGPLSFERIAVTPEQITAMRLPTRPTKVKNNPHAKGWDPEEESVELDAIPPGELRALLREAIEQHVDQERLDHLRMVEAEERKQLALFAKQLDVKDD